MKNIGKKWGWMDKYSWNIKINTYLQDWESFAKQCEEKVKGICHLNGNCWRKLRAWHLEQYIKNMDNSHGFLYLLETFYSEVARDVFNFGSIYRRTLVERDDYFNTTGNLDKLKSTKCSIKDYSKSTR